MQHNPYTWNVLGPGLVRTESITASSRAIDRTLKTWVCSMTPAERGEFINGLYQIFEATDAVRLSDLPYAWIRNFAKVSETWKNTSPETRRLFHETFALLFEASKKALPF